MVNIVEVNDNEDWSDSSSVASSLEDSEEKELALYDPSQETIRERLAALKDMVPPSTRQAVADSVATTFDWAKWTGSKIGSAAWIVTTSALVVGLPLMLSIEGEAAIVAQEKEYLGAQVSCHGGSRDRRRLRLSLSLGRLTIAPSIPP